MEKFPTIEEHQVVVMRADLLTGNILDENFNLVLNDSQKVYTRFGCYMEAVSFIELVMKEKKNIEFVIYGINKKVLKYFTSNADF